MRPSTREARIAEVPPSMRVEPLVIHDRQPPPESRGRWLMFGRRRPIVSDHRAARRSRSIASNVVSTSLVYAAQPASAPGGHQRESGREQVPARNESSNRVLRGRIRAGPEARNIGVELGEALLRGSSICRSGSHERSLSRSQLSTTVVERPLLVRESLLLRDELALSSRRSTSSPVVLTSACLALTADCATRTFSLAWSVSAELSLAPQLAAITTASSVVIEIWSRQPPLRAANLARLLVFSLVSNWLRATWLWAP